MRTFFAVLGVLSLALLFKGDSFLLKDQQNVLGVLVTAESASPAVIYTTEDKFITVERWDDINDWEKDPTLEMKYLKWAGNYKWEGEALKKEIEELRKTISAKDAEIADKEEAIRGMKRRLDESAGDASTSAFAKILSMDVKMELDEIRIEGLVKNVGKETARKIIVYLYLYDGDGKLLSGKDEAGASALKMEVLKQGDILEPGKEARFTLVEKAGRNVKSFRTAVYTDEK